MPRLLLISTGDVIAYSTGARPGLARGADLLADLPVRDPGVDVVVEDVLAEPSWDTSPATMLAVARRARSALVEDGFDGVVVTHGVDTVEETAFLTDLVLGAAARHGTVVFTGAVRPRDAPAADGPRNLADALAVAADPLLRGAGAVVCLDGEVHAARWVTLVDATAPRALSSAPWPLLARVVAGAVRALPTTAPTAPPRPPALAGEPHTDVALIATYPGMDPGVIATAVDLGCRGVVLEGTGTGNVPASLFTTIHELTGWDIPVVVASRARAGAGRLDELPAPAGLAARFGAIGAAGLSPVKARYGLMAALTTGGVERCRAWFAGL